MLNCFYDMVDQQEWGKPYSQQGWLTEALARILKLHRN